VREGRSRLSHVAGSLAVELTAGQKQAGGDGIMVGGVAAGLVGADDGGVEHVEPIGGDEDVVDFGAAGSAGEGMKGANVAGVGMAKPEGIEQRPG